MSANRFLLALSLLAAMIATCHAATVLELLEKFDVDKIISPEDRQEQNNRNCLCKGPACVCCVDFNMTFVDLGGPGCVHMKYLSPDDGFSVNVSYGKNLLHSSKIQGANPAPICLDMFGKFAQLCAKFSDLAPTSDGLRGCLELEPRLLGETQLDFPIGCFKSTAEGMEMEDPPAETEETTEEGPEESTEGGIDAENLLQGIYQTAEQGVAFLSSLLDLPNKLNANPAAVTNATTVAPEPSQGATARRAPKNLKHPNLL